MLGLIAAGFGLGALVFTPIQMAFVNPDNLPVNSTTRCASISQIFLAIKYYQRP